MTHLADEISTYPQPGQLLSGDALRAATEAWDAYGRAKFREVLGEILDALEWSFDHKADVERVSDAEVDDLWRSGCKALHPGDRGTGCRFVDRRVQFSSVEWRDGMLRSEFAAHSDVESWRSLRQRLTNLLRRTRMK